MFDSQFAVFFKEDSTLPNAHTKLHNTPCEALTEALILRFGKEEVQQSFYKHIEELPLLEQYERAIQFLISVFGDTAYLTEF